MKFKLLSSPELIVEKLYQLGLTTSPAELLENHPPKVNAAGQLTAISFPWLKKHNKLHKSWDNTVLGQILVTKTQLTIEVNSKERADQIIAKVNELAGDLVKYLATELQNPENMSSSQQEYQPSLAEQDAMQQIIAKLSKEWLDTKIPLLHNKTPKQAVKTKKGRERLEILLQELAFNRDQANFGLDLDYLKQELKL